MRFLALDERTIAAFLLFLRPFFFIRARRLIQCECLTGSQANELDAISRQDAPRSGVATYHGLDMVDLSLCFKRGIPTFRWGTTKHNKFSFKPVDSGCKLAFAKYKKEPKLSFDSTFSGVRDGNSLHASSEDLAGTEFLPVDEITASGLAIASKRAFPLEARR